MLFISFKEKYDSNKKQLTIDPFMRESFCKKKKMISSTITITTRSSVYIYFYFIYARHQVSNLNQISMSYDNISSRVTRLFEYWMNGEGKES